MVDTQVRTVAIVHQTNKRPIMMSEGNQEFCSVLSNVSATGKVILPFIVWVGKTHWESYYKKGYDRDATCVVSDSGYMDDKLGMLYISQHFEPHTRAIGKRP